MTTSNTENKETNKHSRLDKEKEIIDQTIKKIENTYEFIEESKKILAGKKEPEKPVKEKTSSIRKATLQTHTTADKQLETISITKEIDKLVQALKEIIELASWTEEKQDQNKKTHEPSNNEQTQTRPSKETKKHSLAETTNLHKENEAFAHTQLMEILLGEEKNAEILEETKKLYNKLANIEEKKTRNNSLILTKKPSLIDALLSDTPSYAKLLLPQHCGQTIKNIANKMIRTGDYKVKDLFQLSACNNKPTENHVLNYSTGNKINYLSIPDRTAYAISAYFWENLENNYPDSVLIELLTPIRSIDNKVYEWLGGNVKIFTQKTEVYKRPIHALLLYPRNTVSKNDYVGIINNPQERKEKTPTILKISSAISPDTYKKGTSPLNTYIYNNQQVKQELMSTLEQVLQLIRETETKEKQDPEIDYGTEDIKKTFLYNVLLDETNPFIYLDQDTIEKINLVNSLNAYAYRKALANNTISKKRKITMDKWQEFVKELFDNKKDVHKGHTMHKQDIHSSPIFKYQDYFAYQPEIIGWILEKTNDHKENNYPEKLRLAMLQVTQKAVENTLITQTINNAHTLITNTTQETKTTNNKKQENTKQEKNENTNKNPETTQVVVIKDISGLSYGTPDPLTDPKINNIWAPVTVIPFSTGQDNEDELLQAVNVTQACVNIEKGMERLKNTQKTNNTKTEKITDKNKDTPKQKNNDHEKNKIVVYTNNTSTKQKFISNVLPLGYNESYSWNNTQEYLKIAVEKKLLEKTTEKEKYLLAKEITSYAEELRKINEQLGKTGKQLTSTTTPQQIQEIISQIGTEGMNELLKAIEENVITEKLVDAISEIIASYLVTRLHKNGVFPRKGKPSKEAKTIAKKNFLAGLKKQLSVNRTETGNKILEKITIDTDERPEPIDIQPVAFVTEDEELLQHYEIELNSNRALEGLEKILVYHLARVGEKTFTPNNEHHNNEEKDIDLFIEERKDAYEKHPLISKHPLLTDFVTTTKTSYTYMENEEIEETYRSIAYTNYPECITVENLSSMGKTRKCVEEAIQKDSETRGWGESTEKIVQELRQIVPKIDAVKTTVRLTKELNSYSYKTPVQTKKTYLLLRQITKKIPELAGHIGHWAEQNTIINECNNYAEASQKASKETEKMLRIQEEIGKEIYRLGEKIGEILTRPKTRETKNQNNTRKNNEKHGENAKNGTDTAEIIEKEITEALEKIELIAKQYADTFLALEKTKRKTAVIKATKTLELCQTIIPESMEYYKENLKPRIKLMENMIDPEKQHTDMIQRQGKNKEKINKNTNKKRPPSFLRYADHYVKTYLKAFSNQIDIATKTLETSIRRKNGRNNIINIPRKTIEKYQKGEKTPVEHLKNTHKAITLLIKNYFRKQETNKQQNNTNNNNNKQATNNNNKDPLKIEAKDGTIKAKIHALSRELPNQIHKTLINAFPNTKEGDENKQKAFELYYSGDEQDITLSYDVFVNNILTDYSERFLNAWIKHETTPETRLSALKTNENAMGHEKHAPLIYPELLKPKIVDTTIYYKYRNKDTLDNIKETIDTGLAKITEIYEETLWNFLMAHGVKTHKNQFPHNPKIDLLKEKMHNIPYIEILRRMIEEQELKITKLANQERNETPTQENNHDTHVEKNMDLKPPVFRLIPIEIAVERPLGSEKTFPEILAMTANAMIIENYNRARENAEKQLKNANTYKNTTDSYAKEDTEEKQNNQTVYLIDGKPVISETTKHVYNEVNHRNKTNPSTETYAMQATNLLNQLVRNAITKPVGVKIAKNTFEVK